MNVKGLHSAGTHGHFQDRAVVPCPMSDVVLCRFQKSGAKAEATAPEVPLHRHEGRGRADDEKVVGVGEEPDTRNDDCAAMESASRSLV